MIQTDPLAVVRDAATLDAHRARSKAARTTARPFIVAALCACAVEIALAASVFMGGHTRDVMIYQLLCMGVFVVSWGAAQLQIGRYLRDHPLDSDR